MKVTHVRITRAESERSEIIVAFVAVFVFGVTLGCGLMLYQNGKLSFPSVSTMDHLGAVALSDVGGAEPTAVVTTSVTEAPLSDTSVPKNSQVSQNTVDARRATLANSADLALRITDRTIAIDRVNREIERTKDTSVALITAFDQNCGNWTDDCAKPYTAKLEESNATYNDLVVKLNSLSADLAVLNAEMVSLSN